jgi:hypothetical protein
LVTEVVVIISPPSIPIATFLVDCCFGSYSENLASLVLDLYSPDCSSASGTNY